MPDDAMYQAQVSSDLITAIKIEVQYRRTTQKINTGVVDFGRCMQTQKR